MEDQPEKVADTWRRWRDAYRALEADPDNDFKRIEMMKARRAWLNISGDRDV